MSLHRNTHLILGFEHWKWDQ